MKRTKSVSTALLADVRELILSTRQTVAQGVNAALVMLYWNIGERIRKDILQEKRAEYGERIVSALSAQLEREFGRGFGARNLFRMIRFAEVFPDRKIVSALMTQLGWTHFLYLIGWDDPLKRDFYAESGGAHGRCRRRSVRCSSNERRCHANPPNWPRWN